MNTIKIYLLNALMVTCLMANGQDSTSVTEKVVGLDQVEVMVHRTTTTLAKSGRVVSVIAKSELQSIPVQSVQDVLDYVSGVDLRQRGQDGIQADVSIRGGTFDQVMVLLNGINISDPQTGHLSMNLPIDMASVERIEILEGPGSQVFGPNAFSGAINIITTQSDQSFIKARLVGGEYGYLNSGVSASVKTGNYQSFVSGQYSKSDGYHDNTDFKQHNLYYNGKLKTGNDMVEFQVGYNDKSFGAFAFYTPKLPHQYEQNRTLISSIKYSTGNKIRVTPALYWRRNHDRFEFNRYNLASGINYHMTDVFGANVNASTQWKFGVTSFGGELRSENIWSNNMGLPMDTILPVPGESGAYFNKSYSRVNSSLFLEHTYNYQKLSATFGVLMNMNTGLDYKARFFPGIDLSYSVNEAIKVYGSVNNALRMPTFTDLFYKTSTAIGNLGLKPEEIWAYELGMYYTKGWSYLNINGFYRDGKNLIDWGRTVSTDPFQSSNISNLSSYGLQVDYKVTTTSEFQRRYLIQSFEVDYMYLFQDKVVNPNYESRYVLDYLRNKAVFSLNHKVVSKLSASWSVIYQDRQGSYTDVNNALVPYQKVWLANFKMNWNAPNYIIFAEASNLFDKTTYDIGNVPLPGRWIRMGLIVQLGL